MQTNIVMQVLQATVLSCNWQFPSVLVWARSFKYTYRQLWILGWFSVCVWMWESSQVYLYIPKSQDHLRRLYNLHSVPHPLNLWFRSGKKREKKILVSLWENRGKTRGKITLQRHKYREEWNNSGKKYKIRKQNYKIQTKVMLWQCYSV